MKKALISTNQFTGPTGTEGYRVAQVVEVGEEFEVNPTNLMWVDCDDAVESDSWWYRISDNSIQKGPDVDEQPALQYDVEGNQTTYNEFNWTTCLWESKTVE